MPGTGEVLAVSTVLVAIGEEPDPSILPEGAGIGVVGAARIEADPRSLATTRTGVFAGGDVVSGAKTVIDAVAAGRRAAGSIHEYLAHVTDGEAAILAAVRVPRTAEPHVTLDLAVTARRHGAVAPYVAGSFAQTEGGLTPGDARREAARCFRCDVLDSCEAVTVVAGRGPDRELAAQRGPTLAAAAESAPTATAPTGWLTAVPPAPSALHTQRGGAR
jgi:hypothetical protein